MARQQPEPVVHARGWYWYLTHNDTFLNVIKIGDSYYCQRVIGVYCLADFTGATEVWYGRAGTVAEGIEKTIDAYHKGVRNVGVK